MFTRTLLIAALAFTTASGIAQQAVSSSDSSLLAMKRNAWRAWRGSHPGVLSLQHTLTVLGEMQADSVFRFSPSQAAQILALVEPWRQKASITEAQAKKLDRDLKELLNSAQFGRVANAPPLRPGPPEEPKGLPGHGQVKINARSFPYPRDYNPVNPYTMPNTPMQPRIMRAFSALMSNLKTAAARGETRKTPRP